jgi:hypothetical protein
MELKGLFGLGIDDSIWNDAGLGDLDDGSPAPDWLADDCTRQGIRALLERDRCEEEEERICRERDALQQWMRDRYTAIVHAIELEMQGMSIK